LSIFILPANADTKIVAKSGDTLFKLSEQYGVSLKELMHKNNFNDANKILEGKVIIIPLNNNHNENQINTYKVIKGDTLYKIARDFNVNLKDIISINNLNATSFLKPNQIIIIPKGSIYKKVPNNNKNINLANKKVFYHQTYKIEELSDIAAIHKIPKEEILTLNKLNDPIRINPNTKLKIRKNNTLKWLKYNSLKINWTDWTYLDGYYITQAKNKKDRSFYLAINCERRVLNNTLKNSDWTSWYFPNSDFEFKLMNDFCDNDFNF
tara:strand:+ start:153 stop:950 length:798 start_codon:yes stop_codon:yes gene_type:complete